METVTHEIEPVYDKYSKILILGTIPSPKSRETGFYYGHPRNNFWRVLAAVLHEQVPITIEDKKRLLLANNIALWDVLKQCDIKGAEDTSIKNPIVNDLCDIIGKSQITRVFTTGKKATSLYMKLAYEKTGIKAEYLPSTSPANIANYSFSELAAAYANIV